MPVVLFATFFGSSKSAPAPQCGRGLKLGFHNFILYFLGLDFLLTPDQVHLKTKSTVFVDLWAGSYNTVALTDKVTTLHRINRTF